MTDTDARLRSIFSSLFGAAGNALSDGDGIANVNAWDSASQLDLIMAIEAEFDVYFDVADLSELTSVGAIRRKLAEFES